MLIDIKAYTNIMQGYIRPFSEKYLVPEAESKLHIKQTH